MRWCTLLIGLIIVRSLAPSDICRAEETRIVTGVFPSVVNGAATYTYKGTYAFSIRSGFRPDTVLLVLPELGVVASCAYTWKSEEPQFSMFTERGSAVPFDRLSPIKDSLLFDGARYPLVPKLPSSAETLYVEVGLQQRVSARAGKTSEPAVNSVSATDFGAGSLVDFNNQGIQRFLEFLQREYGWMSEHAGWRQGPIASLVRWIRVHNPPEKAPPPALNGLSFARTLASRVPDDPSADCFGLANLTQACFARSSVSSRAVLVARPVFNNYGNDAKGEGSAMHVAVEFFTRCGWSLMDPQVSDTYSPPTVRLGCAREAQYLIATSKTRELTYERTHYRLTKVKGSGSLVPGNGEGRVGPFLQNESYYRQTVRPDLPCDSLCLSVASGKGSSDRR